MLRHISPQPLKHKGRRTKTQSDYVSSWQLWLRAEPVGHVETRILLLH